MALVDQDDWLHEPEATPGWQENWLFAGLDAASRTGFYVHLGRLTDFDRYDVKVAVAVGGEVVSTSVSRPLEHPAKDDLGTGGLEVTALEPFRRWRVRYDGSGRAGPVDGLLCAGGAARGSGGVPGRDRVPLHLDVTFEALGPPLDMAGGMRLLADRGNDGGHYEQGLRWRGTARAGGSAVDAGGLAVRDHSWGVRRLGGITGVWWCPMVVEAGDGRSGPTQLGGISLIAGDQAVRMAFRQDGEGPLHASRHFDLDLADVDHARQWEATCLHYGAPGDPAALDVAVERVLRFPIAYPQGWGAPFVSDETLCRVRLADGRSGFGIVEWNGPRP